MKKLTTGITVALASLLLAAAAPAQEEEEQVIERIEQMAEESADIAEQIGESMEAWADEHSEELEQWAEQYSDQWEAWGEQFEQKMEQWAERQESVWEEWAERYSEKWEEWGHQLESGDLDSAEMSELIEHNLEMLSEMPLGQMIEGVLTEGVGGLKSAPWESLNDLQDLVQESLEQSLEGLEEMSKEPGESRQQFERTGDKMTKALATVREGLDAKLKRLDEDADDRLSQLKDLLKSTELTEEQRAVISNLAETIRIKRVRQAAELRELAEVARKRAKAAAREDRQRRRTVKHAEERTWTELAEESRDAAKIKALKKQFLDRRQEKDEAADAFYQEALRKRSSVKAKDSEIEDLLREIKELRKEVNDLKKEIDG